MILNGGFNMTQQEYMNKLNLAFGSYLMNNRSILDAYCYRDDRARNCISAFKKYVESLGLKLSNCHHANGIGNNNDYMIFVETKDADGFVIQKNVANFYYCYGIYGGCYVMLKDLVTNEKLVVGRAR
jgi:hypothetical protein